MGASPALTERAMETLDRVMSGRFRVGRMLGAGGMGTVHEAVDITIDRPIALKLLRTGLASDPLQLQRFEREARAAARLAHPNVVGVTELVRDEALGLALVMELLAGESLATRLERGPLTEAESVNVFMQALDGLAAAHAAGMVHRDLKPSNVFLVPIAGGTLVKLLDFGIVKLAEDGAQPKLTRKGALIGTPTYMSPEQIACEPVDARSDVYSMGACLYEALVAEPPYRAAHSLALIAAVGAGPPRDLRELDRDVSPDLAHIARVAMSRDPNGRYQTAAAMREALRGAVIGRPRVPRAASSIATQETTIAARRPARAPYAAIPYVAIAVAATLAMVALGALVAWRRNDPTPPAPVSLPTAEPVHAITTETLAPREPAPVTVREVPRGIDPPEEPMIAEPPSRRPPPRAHAIAPVADPPTPPPPPSGGRIGEDVIDPFAH